MKKNETISPHEIIYEAEKRYGIPYGSIVSRTRDRAVVVARKEVAKKIYEMGIFSTPEIGRILGGRDHTSILYYIGSLKRNKAPVDNL